MSHRLQCIILLKSEAEPGSYARLEGSSTLEGYTLVSPHLRNQFPVSMISSSTPIVTHEQVNPSPNTKYDLIEVWQDHTSISDQKVAAKRKKLPLYVDVYNLDIVRRLFPAVSNIQFVTRFRINEKCFIHQMFTALEEGNLKTIKKLLESGAEIRWRRPEGGTTLAHFAAAKGSAPLFALLSQCGVDLDAGLNEDATPLHIAVKNEDFETVKALLENGADINGRAADGSSALHLATKAGLLEIVRLLAGGGAHLDAKNVKGWTPLHVAADIGHKEIALLLLEHGADLESRIENSPDEGATPLHAAIKKKRWTVAKQLVENGASPDAECVEGHNALYFAVAAEEVNFIKFLLDGQLDVTSPGNRKAFYLAFRKNYSFLLKKMMELGFSVEASDAAEPDVLFGAIHKNLFELVEKLLESGADVHQRHLFLKLKTTPIHVACRYADERMVQLLLDYGADLGALRGTGCLNTTIADAVESGNEKTVKLLLDNNMSVRDRPEFLLSATENQRHELMKLLLDEGVAVNRKASYSYYNSKTSLYFAARQGDQKAMDILTKYGAIFNFKYVSINVRAFSWRRVSAEFLKAFLAHSFTTNLDTAGAADLHKLLTKCNEDNEDGEYYVSLKKRCVKVVAQHIVKMEAAGMAVAGGARSVVPACFFEAFNLDEFRRECEEELNLMKARKIARTRITFFDLLTKTSNRVARYTQNESVRNELENRKFEVDYPRYGSIVECQFQRGNWRRELLNQGIKKLNLLNWRFRALPFELKERVVGFLYNQDLLMLQKCVETSES